jgi:tRNA-dihydrouridine synthase
MSSLAQLVPYRTILTLNADSRYREINLNVGCPSERVAGAGCFGASLMLNPLLVADLCKAIGKLLAKALIAHQVTTMIL